MPERADEEVRFWKRVSLVLAVSLFVAACPLGIRAGTSIVFPPRLPAWRLYNLTPL